MKAYRWFWWMLGTCTAASAVILALMPSEKTLGQVIKIVYLHGALSRAGMVGFAMAAVAGLVYLFSRRAAWVRWSNAFALSGWGFWAAHFLVSMPATRLTWGPWIAWGEPRVTTTLQVLGAGLAVILVGRLVESPPFTALANTLLGGATTFLILRTGALLHPLDPIGSSPSSTLHLIYFALLVMVIGAMFLIAWRLQAAGRTSARAVAAGVETYGELE